MGEIYQAYQLPGSAEACYLNALKLAGNRFRWIYLLARVRSEGRLGRPAPSIRRLFRSNRANLPSAGSPRQCLPAARPPEESGGKFGEALRLDPNCAAAHRRAPARWL